VKNQTLIFIFCTLIFIAGCESTDANKNLLERIDELKGENRELAEQVQIFGNESDQLKLQVQILSGMDSETRLENLYDLEAVAIGDYTNLYDKDEDGAKEKLIVYIEPMDDEGDIIKASGSVEVQLWDLGMAENKAMLGNWLVEPGELKKLWFAAVLGQNYRLSFDISEMVDKFDRALTVKVKFTDYLSGKVFIEQKVIKP